MHQYIPTLDNSAGTVGRSGQTPPGNAEPARSHRRRQHDTYETSERHPARGRQYGNNLRADNHRYGSGHQHRHLVRHRSGNGPDAHATSIYSVAGNRPSNTDPDAPASNAYPNAYSTANRDAVAYHDPDAHQYAVAYTFANSYSITHADEYAHAVANGNIHAVSHTNCDAVANGERDCYRRLITNQSDHPFVR